MENVCTLHTPKLANLVEVDFDLVERLQKVSRDL
jgi:hypothetical protein